MKTKIILFISIFLLLINNVYAKEQIKLKKCIDGDTFKAVIDGTEYTIRMLSIDTPEINPEVEYYGTDLKSDKFDKYQRLLAWVFTDNKLLQEELIEKGYAKVAYLYDDYKYNELLKEKQELASNKNIGVWNEYAKKVYKQKEKEDPDIERHKSIEAILITILLLIITYIYKLLKPIKRH